MMASKKKQVASLFQYDLSSTHPETEQKLLFSSSSHDEAVIAGIRNSSKKDSVRAVVFHQKDHVKYVVKFN